MVGYVVEAVQHPNADRLRVCKVDTGAGVVQVVCGAPNARTGMKGIFAPTGSYIPGTDLHAQGEQDPRRGEQRHAVLRRASCSSATTIAASSTCRPTPRPACRRPRRSASTIAVIEIKVTPNRGDCLGVHGIARDLAAAGARHAEAVQGRARSKGSYASPIKWTHGYEAKPDSPCPIVVGRHFRGVKNGPSPDWLQRRLKAIGLRPISTLVDITNLVTFDLNRPLHVFDAKKLAAISSCARRARARRSWRSTARPTRSIPACR